MRILFLYDFPLWGSGSATFIRELASQLIKRHQVAIISPEKRQFHKAIKQFVVNVPQLPVFVAHPELKNAKKYSEISDLELTEIFCSYLKPTLEALIKFKPDLIDVQHLSLISWVARYANALKRIPYIIYTHGSCLHNISLDRRYHNLSSDALRAAKMIIANSGYTRSWLLLMFGQEFSRKVKIIPGGINIEKYSFKNNQIKIIEKKYNLENKKVVLFSGRLISHKGTEYLVKAAKKIKGDIYVIGEGPEKKNLEKLVQERKLKNVHLLGYLGGDQENELIEFYKRADVFVAPAVWNEPLGLSILEAMICKTPIVATRRGGIPLALKNGVNGIFVRPRNVGEITEAVNRLLDDDELRKKMGQRAYEIARVRFSWKKIARRFERIYQLVVKNNK